MLWSEVLQDPQLQDLPYKIELDHYGRIIMSPASNRHGRLQTEMGYWLHGNLPAGKVITECSIQTDKGVKVADIVWLSQSFIDQHQYDTPYPQAPEICVEFLSPGNSDEEIPEKIQLYLQAGAKEVWICDLNGNIQWRTMPAETFLNQKSPPKPQASCISEQARHTY